MILKPYHLKWGKYYRIIYSVGHDKTKELRGRYDGNYDKEVNSFKGSLGIRRFHYFFVSNPNSTIELDELSIIEIKQIVTLKKEILNGTVVEV